MKILIQAAVVTLFAASTAQAQQAVQWKVSDGGNGHWFCLQTHPYGIQTCGMWTCASGHCQGRGGHLATATSLAELSVIVAAGAPFARVAVGAVIDYTVLPDGSISYDQPQWITGEPWPTGFGAGTPWGPMPSYGYATAGGIVWSPAVTALAPECVCEWSADCNGDGIVDYGQCRDGTLPDYNGNNIPDCCEQGTPCVVGLYPVQWRVEDGGNGHWYAGIVTSLSGASWSTAREIATSQGADLTKVLSPSHRQWLFDRIVSSPALWSESAGPWVGGLQALGSIEPAGGWMWVDDTEIAEGVWSPGQPDNSTDCGGDNNRMGFWNGGSGVPQPWLEDSPDGQVYTPCVGTRVSAVLEWSADCNGDGIVDYGQILQGQLSDLNTDGVPDVCQQPTCADADIYRDFNVNGADLGILLSQWGPNTPLTESDLNSDGVVNGADLGLLLSFWGPCPN
jgi:hypothetical protein